MARHIEEYERSLNIPLDEEPAVCLMSVGHVIDPTMQDPIAQKVAQKYGPRAFALLTRPDSVPIMDARVDPVFVDCQKSLRGMKKDPLYVDFSNINPETGLPQDLQIPDSYRRMRVYIWTEGLIKAARDMGLDMADGVPLEVLVRWNDKGRLHRTLREYQERVIQSVFLESDWQAVRDLPVVPKEIIAKKEELSSVVSRRLEEIEQMYRDMENDIKAFFEEHGVPYTPHPAGVMVRPTWGGGNYEAFYVQRLADGRYRLKSEDKEEFFDDRQSLERWISNEFGQVRTEKFVITRFLQITESPGYNSYLSENGLVYTAPPNGQVFRGSMCVGTSSFSEPPLQDGKYLWTGESVESPSRKKLLDLGRKMVWVFNNYLYNEGGRGFNGFDLMISGFWERAIAELVKNKYPEYADEAVGPITVAEVNMRPTQRTMHLLTQISIKKALEAKAANTDPRPITVEDIIKAYEDASVVYISHDAWRGFPDNALSDLLSNYSQVLAGINGSPFGIYIIMPQVTQEGVPRGPMGVGIVASSKESLREYLQFLSQYTRNEEIKV